MVIQTAQLDDRTFNMDPFTDCGVFYICCPQGNVLFFLTSQFTISLILLIRWVLSPSVSFRVSSCSVDIRVTIYFGRNIW